MAAHSRTPSRSTTTRPARSTPPTSCCSAACPWASYPTDWATINLQYTGSVDASFAFRYHVVDTSVNGDYIGIDSVQVKAVPEPEVLSLFALGLLPTPLAMRRRRAQA